MGPTALLPLRRKWCYGFLSPLKIHRSRSGSNPRTLGPVAKNALQFYFLLYINRPLHMFRFMQKPSSGGWAVPWLRRLVAGLSPRRPGFDPGSVHVRFVVDKVALGQVFLRVVSCPLSISFYWCSITCKTWSKKLLIFITGVAQEALRLRCVRSICCGALHHAKKKSSGGSKLHTFYIQCHLCPYSCAIS
jgi:hypothetical protein